MGRRTQIVKNYLKIKRVADSNVQQPSKGHAFLG